MTIPKPFGYGIILHWSAQFLALWRLQYLLGCLELDGVPPSVNTVPEYEFAV